jgi:hypothetical protein
VIKFTHVRVWRSHTPEFKWIVQIGNLCNFQLGVSDVVERKVRCSEMMAMAKLPPLASELLKQIAAFYLASRDFNGISRNSLLSRDRPEALETLTTLISKELVEVYSAEYDNPHIKRRPPMPIPRQLDFLSGTGDGAHVCLYPSTKYMRRTLPSRKYRNRPFTRLLALGHPQLEPIFFQLSVLERYQSDPRYVFRFDGLDGHISIKTAAYKVSGNG